MNKWWHNFVYGKPVIQKNPIFKKGDILFVDVDGIFCGKNFIVKDIKTENNKVFYSNGNHWFEEKYLGYTKEDIVKSREVNYSLKDKYKIHKIEQFIKNC